VTKNISGQEPGHGFKCFCTFAAEYLDEKAPFQPATADDPSAILGSYTTDKNEKAALAAFIESKPLRHVNVEQLYQPLFAGEIRILELYHAAPGAPLEGQLHVASIDFEYPKFQLEWDKRPVFDASKSAFEQRSLSHAVSLIKKTPMWYSALSYTWGTPDFSKSIKIGKHRIMITSGLATAMSHLRSTMRSVFLWIDQICINQPDLAEKETQVPLMRRIYESATDTLIWLGEEEDSEPHLAFGTLQRAHTGLHLTKAISPDDFERLYLPPADHRSWWAIRELLRRPWFQRTWIIQEACLSRHCYVQYGRAIVSFDDLAAWVQTLHDTGLLRWLLANEGLDDAHSNTVAKSRPPPAGAEALLEMQSRRMFILSHQGLISSFLNVLVLARSAEATNPKDKVYGVLGIASNDVVPDYSDNVTYQEVYHQTSIGLVTKNAFSLPLLSCVDAEIPLRPSWVPDWSAPRVTHDIAFHSRVWGLYMAGGRPVNSPANKIDVVLSNDKKRITIRGKLFDQIAKLGDVSNDPTFCIEQAELGRNEWVSYTKLANNPCSAETYSDHSDSIFNAFFQTLLAGRDGTGMVLPSPDHSEVFSLILDRTSAQEPSLPGQTYSVRRKKGYFTLASLVAQKGKKIRRPVQVLEDMRVALRATLHMRRFAVTKQGYFALVPRGATVGDEVVVFEKCCVPFLLRRVQEPGLNGEVFELVGETYVHGIMRGEAMDMHNLLLRDITLV
jgi:hypothetical protein